MAAAAVGLLAATMPASAQVNPNRLRVCAGAADGNYTFAATEITKRLGNTFSAGIEVLTTEGSVDNLRRLMGRDGNAPECDIGFVQSDVFAQFQTEVPASQTALSQYRKLYEEYVHLVCPVAASWGRINDIGKAAQAGRPARLIVGSPDSGPSWTWRMMRRADPGLYDKVERLNDPVGITSLTQVRDRRDTCMLAVTGLNSPLMQSANRIAVDSRGNAVMRLVDFDDRDIRGLRGPNGQPVYRVTTINRVAASGDNPGVYSNIIERGTFGGGSVNALAVDALLIMRADYQNALGPQRTDRLTTATVDAEPTISRRVNPPSQR